MPTPEHNKLILLCAGGTAGHLFPAEALAHVLAQRGLTVDLATDHRAAHFEFPARAVHLIPSATVRGRNPFALVRTAALLALGTAKAWALIGRLRPAVVVGFGGYPTVPPLWAASLRSVPTVLHEQNGIMGRANRLLAPRVTAIATSFRALAKLDARLLDKINFTGNPVRPNVIAAAATPYAAPDAKLRLLVFGGSQGARVMAEIVPKAIERMAPDLRARLMLVQQARGEDLEIVRATYAQLGVAAECAAFFPNLPERLAAAHLVISRSGASTVAELSAIGRPAILVPLPHALDQDQFVNAGVLADAGGAIRIEQRDFTPERLAAEIARLAADTAGLTRMAAAAKSAGTLDAAERLADLVMKVASGTSALTEFQIETEKKLLEILATNPVDEIKRELVEGPDSFIRFDLRSKEVSAYIYADGAEISGKGMERRFEFHDFNNLVALQIAFLDAARKFLI